MRRIFLSFIIAGVVLSFIAVSARGGLAPGALAQNISIEVEFKETGGTVKKVRGLGAYQRTRDSQYTKQYIVVSDGLTATIRVGQDVPYQEYYKRYLFDHGHVEEIEVTFREIGTRLIVRPKIRGNYIEISLTPQISYIADEGKDVINIEELSTTVMAANGQSISIGGLMKSDEFKDYFFKTKTATNLDIILTPRIQ